MYPVTCLCSPGTPVSEIYSYRQWGVTEGCRQGVTVFLRRQCLGEMEVMRPELSRKSGSGGLEG